jgi:hypothetical protein
VNGVTQWDGLLAAFAGAFTQPSFAIFVTLIRGWVLCPGRRTVTRLITVVDRGGERAHDAYHRFVRAGRWQPDELWRILSRLLVTRLAREGTVSTDLDDTLYHKSGRKIEGAGIFRDAVRSTTRHTVHALGLNLVVLTLRVAPPWGGMPLGLPLTMRLHRKGDDTSLIDHAEAMVSQVAGWFPDRQFHLCCDGAYATLAGRALPRTHVTSRLRRDAALYEAPPPRTGKRGRPARKGTRLPVPEQLAATATHRWQRTHIDMRGQTVERLLWCRQVLWYHVCPDQMVLLVIVRDPAHLDHDDYFITTDLTMAPAQVVAQYAGRWSIEETFRNTKQHLGGEDPQTWKGRGPERAAGLSLWLYSAVWLWYITAHGARPTWVSTPWYARKQTPSFADALAALRAALWRSIISVTPGAAPLPPKIIDSIVEVLAAAA